MAVTGAVSDLGFNRDYPRKSVFSCANLGTWGVGTIDHSQRDSPNSNVYDLRAEFCWLRRIVFYFDYARCKSSEYSNYCAWF